MIYISLLFDIDLEFEHFSFMIKKLAKTHQILFDSYFNQLVNHLVYLFSFFFN